MTRARNPGTPSGRSKLRPSASKVLSSAALVAALAPAARAMPASPPARIDNLALSIQRVTLENGLRVVLNVDRTAPNVAVSVTYDVGSRNEQPGKSGFAHLFEHMMFEGSAHVGKGEHFKLITARGGNLNGTTSTDRTNYFEMLPSSELALAVWLESDRMKSLAVTPENVENQRAVVEEEYRMRVSNQAYAEGMIRLRALAFQGYFPYEHDTIGSMADLDAAKFEYVQAFHDAYYGPDNAVLAIAGDFDPDVAMDYVHQYFADAPRRKVAPPYTPPPVPEQSAPRCADVPDTNARTPGLYVGWVIPPARTPEHYALEMAASILGQGESSRLYQRLVRTDGTAQRVMVWTNDQRGPDLFGLNVVLSEKAKLPEVEKTVDAELSRFAETGPTPAELAKAKTRASSDFLFGLETNLDRANQLAEFELFWGDAKLLTRELEHYQAVTATEVRDAVKKYLTKERRSIVHVLPQGRDGEKAANGGKDGGTCKGT